MSDIISVGLGQRGYDIHVGAGLLAQAGVLLKPLTKGVVPVVSDSHVAELHLPALLENLRAAGIDARAIVMPPGESSKSFAGLERLSGALLDMEIDRNGLVIALGGGVIGDLTGFAAGVLKRGVAFAQIPTTLLAQVDSSVGGKTAINHPLGKNMIGAFYQPRVVIADTDTLKTLPDRELSAGIAEVVKYGLIGDAKFFSWLEANMDRLVARDPAALTHAIEVACRNKAVVVASDEREEGVRAMLNFGHTFGHAIESGLGYGKWLHGEAVAAGMVIAARVSQKMGLVDAAGVERTIQLLRRARLPVQGPKLGVDRYLELMGHDKKVEGGKLRFILLRSIGDAFISDAVPREVLDTVLSGEGVDG